MGARPTRAPRAGSARFEKAGLSVTTAKARPCGVGKFKVNSDALPQARLDQSTQAINFAFAGNLVLQSAREKGVGVVAVDWPGRMQ
jgi:hypothetical protein